VGVCAASPWLLAEVFVDEYGGPLSCRVVICGPAAKRSALGRLGGQGDDADVDILTGEATGPRSCDPDVVPVVCAKDNGFYSHLDALEC
jgi:hypothetical protein